ncbi:sulfatase [Pedobacter sp. BS3]|uniref:sulfatase family protein n=1 Tax=Pedobacter sp. BS3 TaxID=2567937 RepID=UPI0011ED4ADF|nr:sulfatase [Pedobacter sp. BS3]TZF84894.1 sulfatase [Pedobacter sp. BS3]
MYLIIVKKCIKNLRSFKSFVSFYQIHKTLAGILLICVSGAQALAVSRENIRPAKPNIIFLLTDDHRWDALGAMGNRIIQTPNLDKLANAGILFKNAYVTTSICCVSRASILTGQYESRHKIDDFGTDFTKEAVEKTYPILLKNAGYHIGFINKFGVGKKDQPKAYFDYWTCTTKSQPDYKMTDANGNFIHNTDKCGNDIREFLDKFGKKGPFCLSVSFKAPHEQDGNPPEYIIQSRYKDLYKNVTIPEPETADPKYWNNFPDFFRTGQNIARVRWKPLFSTPELYQQTVKNYYRLITGVDDVVGDMVKKLKTMGLDKNTIIIFMGDNGFFLGEHGLEGKWYAYEESIRVPLFIYDPRLPARSRGIQAEQMVLNIDVAPTILNMAGVKVPSVMQGENLLDIVAGKVPERHYFFYEHTYQKSPKIPQSEGIVTKDFKYINYIEHGYEELYSIKKDPHETTNLANNPAYKTVLESLRKQYAEQKKAVL